MALNITFLLMAQYNGKVNIPLEHACMCAVTTSPASTGEIPAQCRDGPSHAGSSADAGKSIRASQTPP